MQSSQYNPDAMLHQQGAKITVEDLINIIKIKEAETNAYKTQNEQLRRELSHYREQEDSLQNHPLTHKSQLSRAKSDPVTKQSRWNSNAEIFLFPDNGSRHTQEPQTLQSPPLTELGKCTDHGLQLSNKVDIETEPGTSLTLRSVIPPSWSDPSMASQGSTGVSEHYFKNVLNELVKTKKYLNKLLHQNKSQEPDTTGELYNYRQEVQQLVFNKKQLERELEDLKEENSKLKTRVPSLAKLHNADDSFELENRVTTSVRGTQTDENYLQMLMENRNLKETLYFLSQDQEGLKKELEEQQTSYKSLSTQVLSVSTLLQEEKNKNKRMDETLRNKVLEAKGLSEKLCILRTKYEDLNEEKNVLEKNLALAGSRGRHSSSQSRSIPNPDTSRGGRFHSQDKRHRIRSPPDTTKHSFPSSASRSDYGPALPAPVLEQDPTRRQPPQRDDLFNNLSRDESKPLNVPNPFHTEECPNCLQIFRNEKSYHAHLEKCIE